MKRILSGAMVTVLVCAFAQAQNVELLDAKPLASRVNPQLKPVQPGPIQVPLITWGADVAPIYAQEKGLYKAAGLDVTLSVENVLAKQVQGALDGKSPFVRGTMGMVTEAAEVFAKAGTELVVVYQHSWSNGGDCLVARESIKNPGDLKGKTVALQLDGPHMDFLAKVLADAGLKFSDIKVKWFRELTLPTSDTGGKIIDPVSAFAADPAIDAVMCISPDAANLTSGGTVGTGSESSVKGAKILLSTKSANRIIADVWAVRADWFQGNRGLVEKLVAGTLKAQEDLQALVAGKDAKQADYQGVLSKSADLLLGASQATADVEGMIADCEFASHALNVGFFTGVGTTRTMKTLGDEIQASFITLGMLSGPIKLANANWDYAVLAAGLKNTGNAPAAKFNTAAVAASVEKQITAELSTWESEGTLFVIEINFQPNQSAFTADQYAADFQKALELSQTYGGAVVTVEGHADPMGLLKARQDGKGPAELAQLEQIGKNLSLQRANSVRDVYLEYCKTKGIKADASQFVAVGLGVQSPKFKKPATKEEWLANMRVVFRIKQVEAELSEFTPLN